MASDADWVEDVRRWYFNGGQAAAKRPFRSESRTPIPAATVDVTAGALGYEAAHPALQAKNWCETGSSTGNSAFADLR